MLTAIVPALWILFDVLICLRTGYMTGAFPRWEWWTWLISGLALAALSIFAQWREGKKHDAKMAELKAGQQRQFEENEIFAAAHLKLDTNIGKLGFAVASLQGVTNTSGAPVVTTIEMATQKIERLEAKVFRHDAIFWGVLDPDDKRTLTTTLVGLGPHSVTVVAHANMDCCELARDIKNCFRDAGWSIAPVQLTGSYLTAGASGLKVIFKSGREALQEPIVSALCAAAHGQCQGIGGGPPPSASDDRSDVTIIVGPKRIHYED